VIVALVIDARYGHVVAHTCGLKRDFFLWIILHVVQVDDAERAPSEFTTVQVPLIVVKYLSVEGLRNGVLGLLRLLMNIRLGVILVFVLSVIIFVGR
jgi:hypothetical protein